MSAWYEETGPSREEVLEDLKNNCHVKKFEHFDWFDEEIDKQIDIFIERNGGFGSYRGYCCWCRGALPTQVIEGFAGYLGEIMAQKVIDKYLKKYINERLFRFPDGLRLSELKSNFYETAQQVDDTGDISNQ